MNFETFKNHFTEKLPIELAYGYTLERQSLHLILYPDKVSRIVTDSADNVMERVDQTDKINFDALLENQKRFYPNRVNPIFHKLVEEYNRYLSITNSDSLSEPKFEFGELIVDLPREEIPIRYMKMNRESIVFDRFFEGKAFGHKPILEYQRMFDDVYILADARMNFGELRQNDFIDISEEEYTTVKNKWDAQNTIGNLTIQEIWTVLDPDGMYLDVGDVDSVSQWYKEYTRNVYPIKHEMVKGYVVIDKNDNMCPDEASDYCYTYEEAVEDLKRVSSIT